MKIRLFPPRIKTLLCQPTQLKQFEDHRQQLFKPKADHDRWTFSNTTPWVKTRTWYPQYFLGWRTRILLVSTCSPHLQCEKV